MRRDKAVIRSAVLALLLDLARTIGWAIVRRWQRPCELHAWHVVRASRADAQGRHRVAGWHSYWARVWARRCAKLRAGSTDAAGVALQAAEQCLGSDDLDTLDE